MTFEMEVLKDILEELKKNNALLEQLIPKEPKTESQRKVKK